MLFTTHAIVGGALGSATGNPYAGFIFGVASHHILDAIPHFDQGTFYNKRNKPNYIKPPAEDILFRFSRRDWLVLFIDWSIAGALFLIIFSTQSLNWVSLLSGVFGGLLPDIIDSSPLWSQKLREKNWLIARYHSFHKFFHWTVPQNHIFLGITTQIIAGIISVSYLLK